MDAKQEYKLAYRACRMQWYNHHTISVIFDTMIAYGANPLVLAKASISFHERSKRVNDTPTWLRYNDSKLAVKRSTWLQAAA